MANRISLLHYLQRGLEALPVIDNNQSKENTRNALYQARDIGSTALWQNFNIASVLQQFGPLLAAARIQAEPHGTSPPEVVAAEIDIRIGVGEYVRPFVRRALRCGFESLAGSPQMTNLTAVMMASGRNAQVIESFEPDFAVFDPTVEMPKDRPNRLPGDAKPSYKWEWALQHSPSPFSRKEFRQALSQVKFYMTQHQAKYSFILTNRELVAIQRLDDSRALLLSNPIPWSASGSEEDPQMTVLLGLWVSSYACF